MLHSDKPYQDKPTVCTWMANTTQICKISFNANSYQADTYIEVKQVIKDGEFEIEAIAEDCNLMNVWFSFQDL